MKKIQIGIKKDISITKVLAIEGYGNYSFIHTHAGKFITSYSITYYERQEIGFWRTHKHALINPNYVKRAEETKVILSNGLEMPISRRKSYRVQRAITCWVGYRQNSTIKTPVTPMVNASIWQDVA